ncbi:N-acetylmuramic acid 6-phosphate etherase [Arachidicoccus rhizosphaerae]|uniref:N-acetylmuramic acid 6-phosphate etherase n=1 Tax=Arachidicoccus rhizosphaerae TaxID=551991 RepID=A0A1H3WPU1_9BACT|nr:N-acetylmuramic acid 6-phosphate etherase [Arachidicoccus rhizosphaerae]SDZ88372.1 N-acetylmuramic acid 6-phosphate etherase [Arachidicoccus rhizosphaerae]
MESFIKTTEQPSHYRHLEKMPLNELLSAMNKEDQQVPKAVQAALPQIEALALAIVEAMAVGGRLFYIGAGTSGRLGVLDASEIPPTFGVSKDYVIGVIAGGNIALTDAVENAEDNSEQGWQDLQAHQIGSKDILVGLATSGTTPYVIGAMQKAKSLGIVTGCVTCNKNAPISQVADFPIEVVVGPEFLTGSTRLKSGTAQKMVLNMLSTIAMIRMGRVLDNKMVNMQLTNQKLIERGTRMILEKTNLEPEKAKQLLLNYGSVAAAMEAYNKAK